MLWVHQSDQVVKQFRVFTGILSPNPHRSAPIAVVMTVVRLPHDGETLKDFSEFGI
ncbi:hypothetical protein D3C85_1728190 [compost metagenome]